VKWLLIVADLWLRHTTKWNCYGFSYLKRNSRWPHRYQPIQPGHVLCILHQHIRRDDQSQDCPLSHHTKHCHIWTKLHSHLILTLLVISCRSPAKNDWQTSCTTLHQLWHIFKLHAVYFAHRRSNTDYTIQNIETLQYKKKECENNRIQIMEETGNTKCEIIS